MCGGLLGLCREVETVAVELVGVLWVYNQGVCKESGFGWRIASRQAVVRCAVDFLVCVGRSRRVELVGVLWVMHSMIFVIGL